MSSIVLDIESPGGFTRGVPELATKIRAATRVKPVVAVANHLACSAAYWLASAASEVVASPSAQVGSVGVYMMHEDLSEAAKMDGVKVTFIQSGDFKTEGHEFAPLSDDARAEMQRHCDEVYNRFVSTVASNRGVGADYVLGRYGQGRCLSAARALEVGMIDRIATLEEVIRDRSKVSSSASPLVADKSRLTQYHELVIRSLERE